MEHLNPHEITAVQLFWWMAMTFKSEVLICGPAGHWNPMNDSVPVGEMNVRVPGCGALIFSPFSLFMALVDRGDRP